MEKSFAPVFHLVNVFVLRGCRTLARIVKMNLGVKRVFMRFLSTKVHGILDYTVGGFMAASPWILGFARGGAETKVPEAAGKAAVVYSLLTDYEWGVKKIIPMRQHLMLDLASGVLLAASPWLFGFAKKTYLPHLLMGLFEIGAALVTKQGPDPEPEHSILDA